MVYQKRLDFISLWHVETTGCEPRCFGSVGLLQAKNQGIQIDIWCHGRTVAGSCEIKKIEGTKDGKRHSPWRELILLYDLIFQLVLNEMYTPATTAIRPFWNMVGLLLDTQKIKHCSHSIESLLSCGNVITVKCQQLFELFWSFLNSHIPSTTTCAIMQVVRTITPSGRPMRRRLPPMPSTCPQKDWVKGIELNMYVQDPWREGSSWHEGHKWIDRVYAFLVAETRLILHIKIYNHWWSLFF